MSSNVLLRKRNGFVLITMAIGSMVLFGMMGLALDLGRMFITKNELQTFTDSAALSATLRLNGTEAGLVRAREEVAAMATANRVAFHSTQLTAAERVVEFGSPLGNGGTPNNWQTNPNNVSDVSYSRVWATVDVPIYFMAVITGTFSARVQAMSAAGQVPVPSGYEWKQGLFPFTPVTQGGNAPDFGFTAGQEYTLRWPSNANNPDNFCAGDRRYNNNGTYSTNQPIRDVAEMRGSQMRGYYGDHSNANIIRQQIQNDYQVEQYSIGDFIILASGQKQTERDAIITRVMQDGDPEAQTFVQYRNRGNSRRMITVPISDPTQNNAVIGYGKFFLLRYDRYEAGANNPFCAEYVGPGSPEGGDGNGGSPGTNTSTGVTKVRLVI